MSKKPFTEIQKEAKDLFDKKAYEACLFYISQYFTLPEWSDLELSTLYLMMGNTYASIHKYSESIIYIKKSIRLNSENDAAYCALGNAYRSVHQFKLCQSAFENAIKLNPSEPYYYLNLGSIFRTLGKVDDAVSSYREMIRLKPDFAMGYRNLVQSVKYESTDNEEFRALNKLLDNGEISQNQKMHCHYALGKIMHDSRLYDQAFEHFSEANHLRSQKYTRQRQDIESLVERYIQIFTPDFFLNTPRGVASKTPIFIIGLPRSGKTLLQKILCCDPRFAGLDELNLIDSMLNQLKLSSSYQINQSVVRERLSKDNLIAMGHHYLEETRERLPELMIKTIDTTPYHFKYLGMINLIFPNAKIIHVKRNPYDNCLQIYMKYFVSGNFYTYDLDALAEYFQQYLRLMKHWERVLPADMMDLNYEDIVKDSSQVASSIFSFLELEMHPSFESNLRKIDIHQDEIGQWMHYESYLEKHLKIYR
ncbi:MAG: sulfotransferase [Gammaproteobacteria bacterium]